MNFEEFRLLSEVAIQFGGKAYPKFNQAVILAGGAGSGKGFILSNLLQIEGKVFDTDKLKEFAIASLIVCEKVRQEFGVDLKDLKLSNPKDVGKLHKIVTDVGLHRKHLDTTMKSVFFAEKNKKPNLIFDVTLKDIRKLDDLTSVLIDNGYEKENIHVVWVMNKFDVAVEQNKNRPRVVSDETMLTTHEGAALTFAKILSMGEKLKSYLDGDIFIAFNQVGGDSIVVQSGRDSSTITNPDVLKSKKGGVYLKKSDYVQVKEVGKPQKTITELDQRVLDKIREYIPKTITWGT